MDDEGNSNDAYDLEYWKHRGLNFCGEEREDAEELDGVVAVETFRHRADQFPSTPRDFSVLGDVLRQCVNLRELNFSGCNLSQESIRHLFPDGCDYNFPLELLYLNSNPLGPGGIQSLLPLLRSRGTVRCLVLTSTNLGDEGARVLSEALNDTSVCIHQLNIGGEDVISAEAIRGLLASENAKYLKELVITGNRDFRRTEAQIFSTFLQQEDTQLQTLLVGPVDIEWAEQIVSSLSTNSSLRRIEVEHIDQDEDEGNYFERGEAMYHQLSRALMRLVCNQSSLEAFCQSNHVFEDIQFFLDLDDPFMEYPLKLQHALHINSRSNITKHQKLRLKLRALYFDDAFDLAPFLSIFTSLMPYVLEFTTITEKCISSDLDPLRGKYAITREGNLNGAYQFIRNWNLQELFSFPSPAKRIKQLEGEIERLQKELTNSKLVSDEENAFLRRENDCLGLENKRLVAENEKLRQDSNFPHKRSRV